MRDFKKLLVWQKGMEIWKQTYILTKELPPEERFGLISQMNRAASSISANIAEGGSRDSSKDQARFVKIALGSSFELETFCVGLTKLELLGQSKVEPLLALIREEQKMLSGFLKKLET